jgi:flagellar basal-body rod protein FlgG
MIRAMMTAASGMKAQQAQVDTIANNIANANTAGFKKSQLGFRALFYQTVREPGAIRGQGLHDPTGLQFGTGTEISGSSKIFEQGELDATSNPLGVAIQGDGFFQVRLPSGDLRYTRDGNFNRDADGSLVTSEGYYLEPRVTLPTTALSVSIGEDGTVAVQLPTSPTPQQVTQIPVFRFPNAGGLKAVGGNFYQETAGSGQPIQAIAGRDGAGIFKQGFEERSNVQVVDELVGLILAQRNYEVSSRAIQVGDEMLQQTNQLIR